MHLGVAPDYCKGQSFLEFLTLAWTLCVWAPQFTETALAVLGDNTSALQDALHLKGTGPLLAIARELSWRQAKGGWLFEVGHVPAKSNTVADALSRRGEAGIVFPARALRGASEVAAPLAVDFW